MLAGPFNMQTIFATTRTIAIVGLSDNIERASNEVARYLLPYFTIIPVNPNHQTILGMTCYASLADIPEPVDMVDVFQRSENVMPLVQPSIDKGVQVFWMQLGIPSYSVYLSYSILGFAGLSWAPPGPSSILYNPM